jgi:hypothetical protein
MGLLDECSLFDWKDVGLLHVCSLFDWNVVGWPFQETKDVHHLKVLTKKNLLIRNCELA